MASGTIHTLKVPYFIVLRGKRYSCNLNSYKNTHYRTTNAMKKEFKEIITDDVLDLPIMDKVKLHFVMHYENARKFDIDNFLSIVSKFSCDALVELGRLPDDDYTHIVQVTGTVGSLDRENPHVEMRIKEI